MSLVLTRLAWRLPMQANLKITLLALCDHASDGGVCWPSIAKLAEFTSFSKRHVKRLVHELMDDGFVSVTANRSGGKPGQTRRYQLSLARLSASGVHAANHTSANVTGSAGTGDLDVTTRMTDATERGDKDVTQTTIEQSLNLTSNHADDNISESFNRFWSAYPIKQAKAICASRWRAKKLERIADAILADVEKRKLGDGRWVRGFVPNPLTYINQERWNDDMFPNSTPTAAVPPRFSEKNYIGSSEKQINDLLGSDGSM
jgi:hypothetical protein